MKTMILCDPIDTDWLDAATILRAEVGSGLHGIALEGKDDRDEMGIVLEPFEFAQGLRLHGSHQQFEQYIYRSAEVRTGYKNAPSEPGDLDLCLYSLRKYARLALQGNPTILCLLFAPAHAMVTVDARGHRLQELAPAFLSKVVGRRFRAYLQAQTRLVLITSDPPKQSPGGATIAPAGFNTKAASHAVRLGHQGIELLTTGQVTYPMAPGPRQEAIDIKAGRWSLAKVVDRVNALLSDLDDAYAKTSLPEAPDVLRVERFVLEAYYTHWQATFGHDLVMDAIARKAAVAGVATPELYDRTYC